MGVFSPEPSLFPEQIRGTQSLHNPVIPNVKPWEAFPKFKRPQAVTGQDVFKRRSSWISPRRWKEWFCKLQYYDSGFFHPFSPSEFDAIFYFSSIMNPASKRHKRSRSAEDWPLLYEERRATAADWKAYGYWARPTINGVQVRNASWFFSSR